MKRKIIVSVSLAILGLSLLAVIVSFGVVEIICSSAFSEIHIFDY